ncbi:Mlp family lipoprotein (plasmid) [Borreliella yangtzensis]|uniref:Mlp family lipoprotein n=1 Tax=Borreliella yangtzensis TaxID=683292 RepID=UPI003B9FBBFF
MKIINTLFCLFLIILNSCNSNDHNTLKNNNKLTELQQAKNGEKHDSGQIELQQEIPKSPEELLKEKLSEDQKIHLDWLKTALTNAGEFDRFLQYDVSKIKTALDHIKTELNKCKGKKTAAKQENIFKEMVKGAFSGGNIDQIQQALSLCDILP